MKFIVNIFKSLQPIFFISIIIILLAVVFFTYDQYNTFKENKLAAALTDNLVLKSSCKTIANEGAKFDLKFTLENKNNTSVQIERIGIDQNFFGLDKKRFMDLVSTNPISVRNGNEDQYSLSNFKDVVSVSAQSSKDLTITLQATSRSTAGAQRATIMIYTGKILLSLSHGIRAEAPCEVQVRYSE